MMTGIERITLVLAVVGTVSGLVGTGVAVVALLRTRRMVVVQLSLLQTYLNDPAPHWICLVSVATGAQPLALDRISIEWTDRAQPLETGMTPCTHWPSREGWKVMGNTGGDRIDAHDQATYAFEISPILSGAHMRAVASTLNGIRFVSGDAVVPPFEAS